MISPLDRRIPQLAASLVALLLAGCGVGSVSFPAVSPVGATPAAQLSGAVHGGQQPVSGATIQLYSVGTSSDAGTATPLLTTAVTTSSTGTFSITGDYTCPTATATFPGHVYITATGGDPGQGSGKTNPQLVLMAALGPCSTLATTTYINLNEVTTVAAVAALYPFMKDYTELGTGTTNAAALTSAMSLVSAFASTSTSAVPGPSLGSTSTFSATTLVSLANALSACVNSTGGSSGDGSNCGTLFKAAIPTSAIAPTNTVAALVNIFKTPTLGTSTIFGLVPATPPFQTGLTAAPTTWALPITPTATPSAGTLQFAASAYSVSESGGSVTLSVTRTGGSSGAVSAMYTTADIVAANGFDYTPTAGTLTWATGDTSTKTITVPVTDVGITSSSNSFGVGLFAPTGGAVLGATPWSIVTITDNDTSPAYFIIQNSTATVNENAGSIQVEVKRQNTLTQTTSVTLYTTTGNSIGGTNVYGPDLAVPGTDYTTTTQTLTFTPTGTNIQYVTIPILDRQLTTGSHVFIAALENASAGAYLGETTYQLITINDNDSIPGTIALAASTASVSENAGAVELLVTRATGATGAVTVNYATANGTAAAGTDYTATTGTLSWATGDQSSRIIAIPITDESLATGSKAFSLALSGITGGATLGTATTTITINDNDTAPGTIALSAGTYSVNENAGTATFSVPRTAGSTGAVSVTYTTQDNTALAGTDYTATSGTLSWADGDASTKSITVPLTDLKLASGSKLFALRLTSISGTALFGSPTSALVTINENDSASSAGSLQLAASSYSTSESSGAVSLSVTRTSGSTGAVTVHYTTVDYSATAGTDYATTSGTLSWASGDSSAKTISTNLYDVSLYSGTRTFYVALSSPTGGAVVGVNSSVPVVIAESDPIVYPTNHTFSNSVNVSYADQNDALSPYSPITYTWGQTPINDFGPDQVNWNTSVSLTPVSALPAAGVHPRLLFTAADLPAIRSRFANTVSGQLIHNKLLAYSAGLHGTYSDTAAYTIPDLWQGGWEGSHGNTYVRDYKDPSTFWYPGNHTLTDMANGVHPVDVASGQPLVTDQIWPMFAYEAARCLIDQDSTNATLLASAVSNEITWEQAARTAAGTATPYTASVGSGEAGFYLAYVYDWLYNYLTTAQITQFESELANTTWAHDNYGTNNTASATRSNWATFSYWLPGPLSIGGETGYNDIKVAGEYREYRNFMTYGIFPSGTFIEGEAKDQLGSNAVLMFARNFPQNLFQHPNLLAYVHKFLPASVIPNPSYIDPGSTFGPGPFVRYDLLGGTEQINNDDMYTLHYMFPNDNVVDWMYQTSVGSSYQNLTPGAGPEAPGAPYYDELLTAILTVTDFDSANSNPATLGLPLTYFSGERALMMTRSDWGTNAMMLNMHTREFNGGHPMDDRNAIFLFGKGRLWFPINQANFLNNNQSIVNIDASVTSPPVQSVTTPGRMVDFQDQPYATFAVGDASYPWNWTDTTPGTAYSPAEIAAGKFVVPTGSTYETHSKNSFAYTKLVSDEMNAPVSQLPSWIGYNGFTTPVTRATNFPVVKAYRTTGLVRGPDSTSDPYGLIVDDIQVSTTVVHHYDWQALLVNDLQIISEAPLQTAEGVYDITLSGSASPAPGDAMLLVRVLDLNYSSTSTVVAPYILAASTTNTRADTKRPMLIIPADSISPNYKVMLFPYALGDTLPTTTWNASHSAVTIGMPTYTDTVTFSPAASGKTDVNIIRSQSGSTSTLINLNTPIAPFN